MKIRLEEYSRGARVRLSVDDAPMTAIHALVNHFVMACTDLSEKQLSSAGQEPSADAKPWSCLGSAEDLAEMAAPNSILQDVTWKPVETPAEEAPKKRGRPKKVETVGFPPEPVAAVEEATEEPGLPFTTLSETDTVIGAEPAAPSTTTPESSSAPEVLQETTPTPEQPTTAPTDDPEITDSELQRYCAKLAQHFGTPQTVFDLAGQFVPEGAVARPTNIRDNGQRWAFVRAAEEQSGVKYHG